MKKLFYLVLCVVFLVSCGGQKNMLTINRQDAGNPFGDALYGAPNAEIDTDEWFGASGIATGPQVRIHEIYKTALTNAQDIIRQKMKHAYKGAVGNYMNSFGNNAGTDYQSKVEAAGMQIIDVIINETRETKEPKYTPVDDKGNITCYLGIRVYKKDVVSKIANAVANDEKLNIRSQENQFREEMEQILKDFKESN